MNIKHTKEQLEILVSESKSVSDVCRKLRLKPNGGSNYYISKKIKSFYIDTSHFTGKSWSKGAVPKNKKKPEEILVKKESGLHRSPTKQLRRALLESGVTHECNFCEISEWMGEPLVLHVDHKDGDCFNNEKENLRFLCPNCHSLTTTYKAKNISGVISSG